MGKEKIKVLNWNIGGAKVLEQKCTTWRNKVRNDINENLINLLKDQRPDIVTLQEVVSYKQPSDPSRINIIDIDQIKLIGYKCYYFQLIDSLGFSSQDKWDKIKKGRCCVPNCEFQGNHDICCPADCPDIGDIDSCGTANMVQSDWHEASYFSQGNAFLFKEEAPLFPLCDLSRPDEKTPGKRLMSIIHQQEENPIRDIEREKKLGYQNFLIEKTPLSRGSYFGDRDTEPRAAMVAHLIYESPI